MKILGDIEASLQLSIFLHKCDPDYEDINETVLSDLVKKMIDKIPKNINYEVLRTSIFTVFRKIAYDYSHACGTNHF